MRYAAIVTVLGLLAGPAFAQEPVPRDWRRTDLSERTYAATAFAAEVGGVHRATFVAMAPVDRTMADGRVFRGFVMTAEIRCADREWNIAGTTHYAADYSIVAQDGAIAPAPLIRQTPLHAAFTDVCDGGHTGAVGLTTEDPVAVLRWLAGLYPTS